MTFITHNYIFYYIPTRIHKIQKLFIQENTIRTSLKTPFFIQPMYYDRFIVNFN